MIKTLFIIVSLVVLASPANLIAHEKDKKNQDEGKVVELFARSTKYHATENKSDSDTIKGKTSSCAPISTVIKNGIGVVAVDPKIVPYGSIVIAPDGKKFLAVDTGGAVKSKKASRKLADKFDLPATSKEAKAPVLDFYGKTQVGKLWDTFRIVLYQEETPFKDLSLGEKISFIRKITRPS